MKIHKKDASPGTVVLLYVAATRESRQPTNDDRRDVKEKAAAGVEDFSKIQTTTDGLLCSVIIIILVFVFSIKRIIKGMITERD